MFKFFGIILATAFKICKITLMWHLINQTISGKMGYYLDNFITKNSFDVKIKNIFSDEFIETLECMQYIVSIFISVEMDNKKI